MAVYLRGKTWWVRFQVNGQEVRRTAGTESKTEAKKFERELRAQYDRSPSSTKRRTYGEALIRWLESGAPRSMYSHANNTRSITETPLENVPDAASRMAADMLKDGLSAQTINRRLAVVKRVLRLAYREWGWIDRPLDQRVSKLSERGSERHIYLSKAELTALVGQMKNQTAVAVTMVAAYTGLRKSELLSLTPQNWSPPHIILQATTKSGRPRAIPLIEPMHGLMVLPFDITDWDLRKDFEQARAAIGRPEIRFHDLRHTFASWLASDPDVPMTLIRDVLGHSSLAVTSRYAHLRADGLDLITGALNKLH